MRVLLAAAPAAVAWRMGAADYLAAVPEGADMLHLLDSDAPWDDHLVPVMRKHSVPVYDEDLLPALLTDIITGAFMPWRHSYPGKLLLTPEVGPLSEKPSTAVTSAVTF
ncbi:DUF2399 domain-containing protein [Streptomyces sparsogenes]|uniref:DUF2399 domain-containing protein n=1 Tax=Streptomyces sparsogenes TaxID=67365 RepID=UPI0033E92AA7